MGKSTPSRKTNLIESKVQGLKATLMMITVQFITAGVSIFYKLASNDGMSMSILIVYRYLLASIVTFPIALFIERNRRPKLTWMTVFQAFLCALFGGSMAQNLYAKSLVLTSTTFATVFTNLVPLLTFIVAVIFGLERVSLSQMTGKAKVIGTLTGVTGAMVMTFYKGHELKTWSTHFNLLHSSQHIDGHATSTHKNSNDQIFGSILSLGSSLSISLSLILQAKISASYPCQYSSTCLMSMMGFIQSLVFALSTERSLSQWKLSWNIRLLAVLFSGILASGLMASFVMACVRMRGPLFVSIFNPLTLVLVAIASSLVLEETLHVGSVLGSLIIIVGLYLVLWGKSKEIKWLSKLIPSTTSKEGSTTTTNVDEDANMDPTCFITTDEDGELPVKSTTRKEKEQEVVEEEDFK